MDSSDKYIGMLLDNRYEIIERIGTGGMAFVYKARCHRLNRLVAVKILKDELAGDDEFRRRFQTESQAVAMLSHPNIVAVYDVNSFNNIEFIVMELIEGITLKQYINRKGLLNWKEALHFATQIAKALGHAHSRGIIHRDIKPHNIMILKDGSVKVADFGIARLLSMQNTLTQDALGSVHYISPEQAKGGHVDARSDIYSVGVVLYEMLTSQLPFVGDSAVSVAIQHISAIPLMPRDINPDIPEGLENITMHAMEPDLNQRFTTADELLYDLEEFRKNPSATFNYAPTEIFARPSDTDSTKKVPTGAIIKAERSLPKTPAQRSVKKMEMTRDEYRHTHKKASRTSTLIGVFCIIVFLVVVLLFMWNYLLKGIISPSQETITPPNFVGRKFSDVSQDPEYTRLYNFIPTQEYSDKYEEDYIIKQIKPQADRPKTITPGTKTDVEIVVSLGKAPPVQMPDLLNKDYRVAQTELQSLGLDLEIRLQDEMSDEITKDYVIETIPASGDTLVRGGTVYIKYSTGPKAKTVTVPGVVGLDLAEARLRLESLDLTPDPIYVDDDSPKDTVIFQKLVGEDVPLHTKVTIHVSKGPPETTDPTDTNDPNVSPSDTGNPDVSPTDTHSPDTPTDTSSSDPTDTAVGGTTETPVSPLIPTA